MSQNQVDEESGINQVLKNYAPNVIMFLLKAIVGVAVKDTYTHTHYPQKIKVLQNFKNSSTTQALPQMKVKNIKHLWNIHRIFRFNDIYSDNSIQIYSLIQSFKNKKEDRLRKK